MKTKIKNHLKRHAFSYVYGAGVYCAYMVCYMLISDVVEGQNNE